MDKFTNKIFYEDCRVGMRELLEKQIIVDAFIADPPFAINYDAKSSMYNRNSDLVTNDYVEIPRDDYYQFFTEWLGLTYNLLKQSGSGFIFSGWNELEFVLRSIRETGFNVVNHVIWHYQFAPHTTRKFTTSHQHILFVSKSKKYAFNKIINYYQDVLRVDKGEYGEDFSVYSGKTPVLCIKKRYKPNEMKSGAKTPDVLAGALILTCSNENDLILDPFVGNGTIPAMANAYNRQFVGFEVNKNNVDIITNNLNFYKRGELNIKQLKEE